MAKRKLPKRMFKAPDRVSSYQTDRSPRSRMKKMSSEYGDVLQNIEFALVSGYREDRKIDDGAVNEALKASMGRGEPTDPRVQDLWGRLQAIRELREDIPDTIWLEALQVVHESVKRHSSLRPGETSYLSFVSRYVK